MNISTLIDRCTEITKSKGFDVTQHRTQLCLMATEIAEALDDVSISGNWETDEYAEKIRNYSSDYENYRHGKEPIKHFDSSGIWDLNCLLEELADVLIRICSYVGGNGWRDEFVKALADKIEKNKERPYKHGKGF